MYGVLTLLVFITFVSGESYHSIHIRDVDIPSEQHPVDLHMIMQSHQGPVNLRLRRSARDIMNKPVYVLENGKMKRHVSEQADDIALYQDKRYHASVAVRSVKVHDAPLYKRSLTGTIHLNGQMYEISPSKRGADQDGNQDDDGIPHEPESRRKRGSDDDKEDDGIPQVPESRRKRSLDTEMKDEPMGTFHTLTRREIKNTRITDYDAVPIPEHEAKREALEAQLAAARKRKRRGTSGKRTFGVELLVGIDYSVFKRFKENVDDVMLYYAQVIQGIDMRYEDIEADDFEMYVGLAAYVIAKSPTDFPWTDPAAECSGTGRCLVDASESLKRMKKWVADTSPEEHDHFMVFTDYDIYSEMSGGEKQTSVIGMAYGDAICGESSQSITEDHGQLHSCTDTAAHELGHSVGSRHDGRGGAKACPSAALNIMTPLVTLVDEAKASNPFHFSDCSIEQFRKLLIDKKYADKCLDVKESHKSSVFKQHTEKVPGQIWTLDSQCEAIYANGYYCGGPYCQEALCHKLCCWNPKSKTCIAEGGRGAIRGSTCGDGKWCSKGKCVSHPDAPRVADPDCIYGDWKVPLHDGTMCAVRGKSAFFCRAGNNGKDCCGTCNKLKTGIPGCEWGDEVPNCTKDDCTTVKKSKCCKTCQ